ncbi:MAG TPA: hypothetical protein DDY98_05600, partial [Ruminococcaceae bacterium]|nr:hypothetical protein [Oscillospiraceae bacterium]
TPENTPEKAPEKIPEEVEEYFVPDLETARKTEADDVPPEVNPSAEAVPASEQAQPNPAPIYTAPYASGAQNPIDSNQPYQPRYAATPNYGQTPYYPTQPPQVEPEKKKKKTGRTVFCVLLAVVILVAGISIPVSLLTAKNGDSGFSIGGKEENDGQNSEQKVNEDAPEIEINQSPKSNAITSGKTLTPAQIYKKIAPSIVAVKLYSKQSENAFTPGTTADDGSSSSAVSEGTGVVYKLDDSGTYSYILTCAHVISESNVMASIETEDGTRYDAEIVGYDARTDVGILRVKGKFEVAEFGDSDALSVGDPIYAIGNPGGSEFFGSFTDGIVSAIGRSITSSIGYDMICIQHNAAISPGNSGGPLLNEYGQVIGINSSKIAATEFEGISFAVPITQAKDVIDKVAAYGYVPGRPRLGISYVPNDSSSISSVYAMAVQMKDLPSGSLVIAKIESSSDLLNTDAQAGDMITAVNGKKMDKADVLLETIANSKVGDTLTLSLFRIQVQNGRYVTSTFDVKVKLIEETNNQNDEEETTRALTYEDIFGF